MQGDVGHLLRIRQADGPWLKRTDTRGNHDSFAIELLACAGFDVERIIVLALDPLDFLAKVQTAVEGFDLFQDRVGQFLSRALGNGWNVVDRLVRIQLGTLPARLADRIDNLRLEAEKTQLKNLEQAAGPCPNHDNISTDHLYGSSKMASALSCDWQRSATAGRFACGIPGINGFCDIPALRDRIQGRIRPGWGSTPANNPARSSTPRRESRRRGPASR